MRKTCPGCGSRKWREDPISRGTWKCGKCRYTYKNPRYHKIVFSKDYRIGDEKHQNNTIKDEKLLRIDFHKNVYKFKILKNNETVSIGRRSSMRNWTMETLERPPVTFRRSPKNIIISIKKRFIEKIRSASDPYSIDEKIRELFVNYAREFQEEFGFKLELKPVPVNKEIKILKAFRSPVQFRGDKVQCVYPNGEIEYIGIDAVESFKNTMDNLAIETRADNILEKMDGGFNTLSYILTQQNEIILKLLNKKSLFTKLKELVKWFIAR